jgi:hypothetical protein
MCQRQCWNSFGRHTIDIAVETKTLKTDVNVVVTITGKNFVCVLIIYNHFGSSNFKMFVGLYHDFAYVVFPLQERRMVVRY